MGLESVVKRGFPENSGGEFEFGGNSDSLDVAARRLRSSGRPPSKAVPVGFGCARTIDANQKSSGFRLLGG